MKHQYHSSLSMAFYSPYFFFKQIAKKKRRGKDWHIFTRHRSLFTTECLHTGIYSSLELKLDKEIEYCQTDRCLKGGFDKSQLAKYTSVITTFLFSCRQCKALSWVAIDRAVHVTGPGLAWLCDIKSYFINCIPPPQVNHISFKLIVSPSNWSYLLQVMINFEVRDGYNTW